MYNVGTYIDHKTQHFYLEIKSLVFTMMANYGIAQQILINFLSNKNAIEISNSIETH